MAAPRVRRHAPRWRPRRSGSRDTDTTPTVHPTGPAPGTCTDHAGPPLHHSIPWCSTIWKRSSPRPPTAIPWATVYRRGWRRICEPTYAAVSSRTVSPGYGVTTVGTSGCSRSHVRRGACARHAIRAAWPRSPPTSRIMCCHTFLCDSGCSAFRSGSVPTWRAARTSLAPSCGSSSVPSARPCVAQARVHPATLSSGRSASCIDSAHH